MIGNAFVSLFSMTSSDDSSAKMIMIIKRVMKMVTVRMRMCIFDQYKKDNVKRQDSLTNKISYEDEGADDDDNED